MYIKLLFNSFGCYWQWTNSCTPHCCHRKSIWKYSYYKYWWYFCTEQQHCCFQWRKQCWHGTCCDERYCNEKKCRWWQLRWGNEVKCQKRCLLLAPRLVRGQTHMCQKRGKGEICQRSPPSLPPQNQENRGPIGDLCLLFALQVLPRGVPRGEVLTSIMKTPPPQKKKKKKKKKTTNKESHLKTPSLKNHKYGAQLHNPVEL